MNEPPLGFILVDTARLYRARIDCAFEQSGVGLTAGEARTLAYVNLYPAHRQSALAVKMNVEPMTLVGFLDRLEALGAIVRETDPADRRAKIVRLTEAATPYLERISSAAATARIEALDGFSTEEQATFRRLLERMRASLVRCKDGT